MSRRECIDRIAPGDRVSAGRNGPRGAFLHYLNMAERKTIVWLTVGYINQRQGKERIFHKSEMNDLMDLPGYIFESEIIAIEKKL